MEVLAPIAGTVVEILAPSGSSISAEQPIMVLESMKMELLVEAPCAGTIAEVRVTPGQSVAEGEVIATIASS